ncbi:MAG TPA: aminotransferase class IV [Blastocatellia bacterium]|nr:aminotransferase class IV [Blastocatellia bacterium]
MDRLVYHNDGIFEVSDAKVAPTLAGVLYGWGLFTTLRIYQGRVFAFEQHWERLLKSAEKARVPLGVDAEAMKRALVEIVAANKLTQGRARITILKGEAGAWRGASAREADVMIFTASDTARQPSPVTLTLSPYRLLASGPLTGIKRTAMIENLLAYDEARSRNFDEAVMLNERGEMVGATAANLFWAQGDELFTPSLATGAIAGVTRRFVNDLAAQAKLHVVEGSFTIQRLLDAREVFLTSTTREIAVVASYDVKQYDLREANIARVIQRRFGNLTRDAAMLL